MQKWQKPQSMTPKNLGGEHFADFVHKRMMN